MIVSVANMNSVSGSVIAEVHDQLWTSGADRLARQTAEQALTECRRQRQALLQALTEIGEVIF